MKRDSSPARLCGFVLLVASTMGAPVVAKDAAHQHGVVRLDVAVDGKTLTLQLEAPLDSLLGFEHRPRTAAQRQASDVLMKRMNDAASLFRPEAAAQCTSTKTSVESEALQPTPAAGAKEDEHADIDVSVEFMCLQPDKLTTIDIGLFDAYKRIQRIDVQVAGAKGQAKQTLKRPESVLKLRR